MRVEEGERGCRVLVGLWRTALSAGAVSIINVTQWSGAGGVAHFIQHPPRHMLLL